MTTLLLADLAVGKLGVATSRVLTAALQLGAPVHILIAGDGTAAAAAEASALYGVEKIVVADDPAFAHMLAEPLAERPKIPLTPRSATPPRGVCRKRCKVSAMRDSCKDSKRRPGKA